MPPKSNVQALVIEPASISGALISWAVTPSISTNGAW